MFFKPYQFPYDSLVNCWFSLSPTLNADSEGVEGKYCVWTSAEIDNLLGNDAMPFKNYYQIADSGNWEGGVNILFTRNSREEFSQRNDLPADEWQERLNESKEKLLLVREKRVKPTTDKKLFPERSHKNALKLKIMQIL